MSSGGFGIVEGLGLVCLAVAQEVGLSIAEISSSVVDAHDIVFRQQAYHSQQKTLARIQEADNEWEQIRTNRMHRLTGVKSQIDSTVEVIRTNTKQLDQIYMKTTSQSNTTSKAKSEAIARIRDIHSTLNQTVNTLSSAPLPASAELEISAQDRCNEVKASSKAIILAAHKIAKATSSETVKRAEREVVLITKTATRQVKNYTDKAVKAQADYSITAQAISRARVGVILLQESPYPDKAKIAAEKSMGSITQIESGLRAAQRDLASGKLQEAKSAAKRYESVVERGQGIALKTTVQIAKKQAARKEKNVSKKIDVDTSGRIVVKVEDSTKTKVVVEKLQTLINDINGSSSGTSRDISRKSGVKDDWQWGEEDNNAGASYDKSWRS